MCGCCAPPSSDTAAAARPPRRPLPQCRRRPGIGDLHSREAHCRSTEVLRDRHSHALEQRQPAIQRVAVHLRYARDSANVAPCARAARKCSSQYRWRCFSSSETPTSIAAPSRASAPTLEEAVIPDANGVERTV